MLSGCRIGLPGGLGEELRYEQVRLDHLVVHLEVAECLFVKREADLLGAFGDVFGIGLGEILDPAGLRGQQLIIWASHGAIGIAGEENATGLQQFRDIF